MVTGEGGFNIQASDLLYYPFVSITWVGALARESGAKSPCTWGSDFDICTDLVKIMYTYGVPIPEKIQERLI